MDHGDCPVQCVGIDGRSELHHDHSDDAYQGPFDDEAPLDSVVAADHVRSGFAGISGASRGRHPLDVRPHGWNKLLRPGWRHYEWHAGGSFRWRSVVVAASVLVL